MKTKLVLWGTDAQDNRVLIALELLPETNKVNIYTFPESVATEEFSQKMLKEWRNNEPIEFPSEHTKLDRELSVTEGLLPEEIKVERGDIIQRAQTEWHFIVLSAKLNESYQGELNALEERVEKLENYDGDVWNALKGFWDKVQVQVRERNLFREHANALRDNTNALFAKMKELRAKLDDEFQRLSGENHDKFMGILEDIEKRISEGLRLQPIFDELKELQRRFRDTKLTREHRSKVWERLDSAFKVVKARRFGAGAAEDKSPMERLNRRYDGLIAAIEKMERSIQRDRDDLEFQNRKIEASDGQLESQIRQAKIKMIQERISSKESKLGEMMQTKSELDRRIETQKEKDAKREERERIEQARKAAEEKIASQIQEKAAAREDESDKFEKAADALGVTPEEEEGKSETPDSESSLLEKAGSMLGAVVAKAKDIAEDVGDKIEEVVEQVQEKGLVEKAKDLAEDVGDKIEEVVEQVQEKGLVEKAKDLAEDVGDKIEEVIEQVQEKGLVEKAKDLAEQAEEKIDEAVEKIADSEIVEKLEDKLEEGVDALNEATEGLGESLGEAVDNLKEQLSGEAQEEKAEENEAPEDTAKKDEDA